MAARYPDRPAVRDDSGDFTYRELDRMSDYIAQKLTENGFGPEQAAGILVRQDKGIYSSLCGCYEGRRSYVPLDPEYPQSRIEYMLKDSGARNLLVIDQYQNLVEFYDGNVISLEQCVR